MHRHAAITAPPGQGSFFLIRISAQIDNESIDAACAVRHILFEAVQYARKEKAHQKSPLSKSDSADLFSAQIEPGDPNLTRDTSALPAQTQTRHQTFQYC
jgi:hypothetical protein